MVRMAGVPTIPVVDLSRSCSEILSKMNIELPLQVKCVGMISLDNLQQNVPRSLLVNFTSNTSLRRSARQRYKVRSNKVSTKSAAKDAEALSILLGDSMNSAGIGPIK
jgi:hypothetical protein